MTIKSDMFHISLKNHINNVINKGSPKEAWRGITILRKQIGTTTELAVIENLK